MENFQDDNQQLILTPRAQELLKSSANWSKFAAIFSIIFISIIAMGTYILYLIARNISNAPGEVQSELSLFTSISFTVTTIVTITYFYSLYKILRFSNIVKTAIRTKNSDTLTHSFEYLKAHYKSLGIMMIVSLIAYFIVSIGFGVFLVYATKIMVQTF